MGPYPLCTLSKKKRSRSYIVTSHRSASFMCTGRSCITCLHTIPHHIPIDILLFCRSSLHNTYTALPPLVTTVDWSSIPVKNGLSSLVLCFLDLLCRSACVSHFQCTDVLYRRNIPTAYELFLSKSVVDGLEQPMQTQSQTPQMASYFLSHKISSFLPESVAPVRRTPKPKWTK